MIRGRAGCSSAGGRAAAAASGAAEVVVSGCGNESINGTYRRDGERDGVPCYRHAAASWTIERDTDRSAGEAASERVVHLRRLRLRVPLLRQGGR
mmetsp:Transcript_8631/g.25042  ORF Transcript_8631/g.25042 Transcript_8631/m.25042 type:complete len:95 (+) Transcript_8631:292-576(+)